MTAIGLSADAIYSYSNVSVIGDWSQQRLMSCASPRRVLAVLWTWRNDGSSPVNAMRWERISDKWWRALETCQQQNTLTCGTVSLMNFPEVLLKWHFFEMKREEIGAFKKHMISLYTDQCDGISLWTLRTSSFLWWNWYLHAKRSV
jgi:hypothetical protein